MTSHIPTTDSLRKQIDPLKLQVASIVNDIQLEYAKRRDAGDEVLSSFGIDALVALIKEQRQHADLIARTEVLSEFIELLDDEQLSTVVRDAEKALKRFKEQLNSLDRRKQDK